MIARESKKYFDTDIECTPIKKYLDEIMEYILNHGTFHLFIKRLSLIYQQ